MSYFNDPTSISEGRLQAVQGYFELGMNDDAWSELADIERCFPATPSIVQMKVLLLLKDKRYDDGFELSSELRRMEPHGCAGYIHGAYCLHELERTNEALDLLEKAPSTVRDEAIYHYNKGCYQAALGDVDTARSCLSKSFDLDERLLAVARKDPDLSGIRDAL
jgi:tetratricopeptide (TPR) repeat protein